MMHMGAEHMNPDVPDIWFGRLRDGPLVPGDLKTNLCLAFPLPAIDIGADARFGVLLDSLQRLHAAHF